MFEKIVFAFDFFHRLKLHFKKVKQKKKKKVLTSRERVRKIRKEGFLLGAGSSFGQIYGFAHI